MSGKALLIGNSDGIGLATTRELLNRGWEIVGISRSPSPIEDPSYEHLVAEVQNDEYLEQLKSVLARGPIDLCIFCVGIGKKLDPSQMDPEAKVFEVNLLAMVRTASCVIPEMVARGKGHFMPLLNQL